MISKALEGGMTEKTIIHINLASDFGGGEVQTLNLIANLPNYRQLVLGRKGKPFSLKASETFQSSRIEVVGFWRALSTSIMHKDVLIHAHDGRGCHLARLISLLSSKPYIISRRVDKALSGKGSAKTYQNACCLVAVSKKVAENIRHLNRNITIVHDSYSNLPSSTDVEQQLIELKHKFVVTQLGSLIDIKNTTFTLDLAKQLQASHPNIHFLIVGKGKEEIHLRQLSINLANVTFFGFTPFVGSILQRTDALIMPSKSEGLGSAVLEAYQHDTPVITSKVGGLPEIVQHGKTGYLVDILDCREAKHHLVRLTTDYAKYRELQQNIQAVKQQYSPEHMAEKYISCYEQVF
jgi:glycosyltransferase involved in cell wall biosynthesis